jgi:hypothetical protein
MWGSYARRELLIPPRSIVCVIALDSRASRNPLIYSNKDSEVVRKERGEKREHGKAISEKSGSDKSFAH